MGNQSYYVEKIFSAKLENVESFIRLTIIVFLVKMVDWVFLWGRDDGITNQDRKSRSESIMFLQSFSSYGELLIRRGSSY